MPDPNNQDPSLYSTLLSKATSIGNPVHGMKPMGGMPGPPVGSLAGVLGKRGIMADKTVSDVWKGAHKLPPIFRPNDMGVDAMDIPMKMIELARYKGYGMAKDAIMGDRGKDLYHTIMEYLIPGAKFDVSTAPYTSSTFPQGIGTEP